MHARVAKMPVQPGSMDRVLLVVQHSIIPEILRQPGCNAVLCMSNRQTNEVLLQSLWESEAHLLASARAEVLQELVSKVITQLRGVPVIEHYEVNEIS
jgi:quinol monooxygenase YgiN